MLNILGIFATNISNMIKNIAQKVKNVFIMTFVMTEEEAQQMAKLKEELCIFKNIILMELMDIPKNITKILMIAIAIVSSLRKNGIELLTKRRELITWRRAVARMVAINRNVSAVIWVNELKAADLEMMIIVEKIAEKIGIQIKPIYASSIDTLVSAAMVSNDALIKAIAAAKESDDTLIDELIDALINVLLIPYDILYDLEWLVKITKMIEYKSDNSMIAVVNAYASNYISDDDKNPDERLAKWHVNKQKIYEKAHNFIDTCPNNLFMPNALISVHREKWHQKIENIKTYSNEDKVRLKRMIEHIEMEITFARKFKAIIAFVIANNFI
jgi:hypothetical protein